MLSLLVREDDETAARPDDLQLARSRMQALEGLQTILQGVLAGEAGMWLRRALSGLSLHSGTHSAAFENLLYNSAASCRGLDADGVTEEPVAKQVARLVCQGHPRGVAMLLGRDGSILRTFFAANESRIVRWFAGFAGGDHGEHQLGARALARFAFVHRETCWEQLEWQGNHAQAPATVAAKPYYFRELDVVQTVENFIAHVPAFWSSEELWDEVLRDGSLICLDFEFFVRELLWRMFNDNCFRTWQLVRDFFANERFSVLCSRILHLANDKELLMFVNDLAAKTDGVSEDGTHTGRNWLGWAVSRGLQWDLLDDLFIGTACVNNGRELYRLVQEDEHKEQADSVKQLIGDLTQSKEGAIQGHWALRRELINFKESLAWKWLALEGWVLYWQLQEQGEPAVRKLLGDLGIEFRVQHSSDLYDDPGEKRRRKRINNSGSRKRKKSPSPEETLVPVGRGPDWRLSVDDFKLVWTKDDIADYLTMSTLEKWLGLTGVIR